LKIADYLNQKADEIVASLQSRQAALKNEIAQLEKLVLDKKSDLETARMASKRRMKFLPTLRGKEQCPVCFIVDDIAADLRMTGIANDGDGVLKCNVCQTAFSIPD
jgi:hypothetical protein